MSPLLLRSWEINRSLGCRNSLVSPLSSHSHHTLLEKFWTSFINTKAQGAGWSQKQDSRATNTEKECSSSFLSVKGTPRALHSSGLDFLARVSCFIATEIFSFGMMDCRCLNRGPFPPGLTLPFSWGHIKGLLEGPSLAWQRGKQNPGSVGSAWAK